MSALFSAVELADASGAGRVGHRLLRLELLNWGTFDQRVWSFTPDGANGLLTGDIGSGKSTVVDAVTSLLVAPQRITFNRAAGAEGRERDLRSYVLGHHKSERNETTGTSRPVGLRTAPTFSVLLAVFGNKGYGTAVSLAQVLWLPEGHSGQPERFYVTAEEALTVTADLTGFGGDPGALRKRLRQRGASVEDTFPAYARRFRRLLGIESEQAMELFHQTVSMKAVGDLNGFVRQHMLEPFDAARWTDALITHFEALTRAHEAVVRARSQLEELTPLLALADSHDRIVERIGDLDTRRAALAPFVAERKLDLLEAQLTRGDQELERLRSEEKTVGSVIDAVEAERQELQRQLDGHGGARLGEIERLVSLLGRDRDARRARHAAYTGHLAAAGLPAVDTAAAFAARRQDIARALDDVRRQLDTVREQRDALAVDQSTLQTREREVNTELTSLRSRRSNIPTAMTELRQRLLEGTGLREDDLPFAGELIQVRPEHQDWEGAAERVLRGFGISLLVPQRHYAAVSDWVDASHLRGRLVYYRVPAADGTVVPAPRAPRSLHPLSDVVEVRDGAFAAWVEQEVVARADLERVETLADLRRLPRAVTRAGQVKTGGGRHVKDDTSRVDDRRSYVLGWSNEAKVDTLLAAARELMTQRAALADRRKRIEGDAERAEARQRSLDQVAGVQAFEEVDWSAVVRDIAALEDERRRLEESSAEIARLTAALRDAGSRLSAQRSRRDGVLARVATTEQDRERGSRELERLGVELAQQTEPPAPAVSEALAALAAQLPADLAAWDAWEREQRTRFTNERDGAAGRRTQVANTLVGAMRDFRRRHPAETAEVDDDVASAGEYRQLHARLVDDDLPRFEADFKKQLNTNAIRDIAGFYAELRKQQSLISERIDTINDSLVGIDYNPGRYIRLETHPTPNVEVREFVSDLRACTDDALGGGDEQYSEHKFHQVRRLVERFRGRDGSTEADRQWTRRVTDVRNWVVFAAVERWREDDREHETYTDSAGKSGGQKEKLAYTILAASLAYQFKLEWGAQRSRAFHVAVIDEAFGRGSDESTRFALSLFERLGLQLLIVTPLQKIHIIEPYVQAVGFVDNPTGASSRLQNLAITEYRERRASHAAAQRDAVAAGAR